MRRLWLLFAQTVTVGLAIWFIVASLKPHWATEMIGSGTQNVRIATSTVPVQEAPAATAPIQASYRDASRRAMPSVVNIFTSKEAKQPKNPLADDPFFRKFFGDRLRP